LYKLVLAGVEQIMSFYGEKQTNLEVLSF
jgi:hypothetical protein